MAGMCRDCFKGTIHEGETKGHITKIHGFDTYVSHPTSPSETSPAILVLIPDGLGWASPNLRLTADRYAARTGCTVYIPDFMDGRPLPLWVADLPMDDILGNWSTPKQLLLKPYYLFWVLYALIPFNLTNGFRKSYKRVYKFFTALRKNEGNGKLVGVAGFCWGGKHAFTLGAGKDVDSGEYLIDFAYTGHPSGVDVPQDIEALQTPISVAMGTEDFLNTVEFSKKMKEGLEKHEAKGGRAGGSEFVFYEGGNHGFACRADLTNERLKECADAAEDQFVRWVERMVQKLSTGTSS
ncbi:hypothetical protein TWF730_010048 [Orbilia blumenaviensis]|uniref:Dienelactone hydrolase domain-containing protein n=1 Tax=Orbilia blumenaviensis TaxID=1796055 RepID=A0AAV9UUA9_9PEZI